MQCFGDGFMSQTFHLPKYFLNVAIFHLMSGNNPCLEHLGVVFFFFLWLCVFSSVSFFKGRQGWMLLSPAGFDVAGVPFGFPRSCHVDLREVNIVGVGRWVMCWNGTFFGGSWVNSNQKHQKPWLCSLILRVLYYTIQFTVVLCGLQQAVVAGSPIHIHQPVYWGSRGFIFVAHYWFN